MERTKRLPAVARKKRMFASIVVVAPAFLSVSKALVPIPVVEGFRSIATKRNCHRHHTIVLSSSFHRNRPLFHTMIEEDAKRLAMSSRPDSETTGAARGDENGSPDDGDDDGRKDNIDLHQQIKRVDPEWYQEYVSDLLGEDYCSNRWPKVDLSVVPEQTGGGTEKENKAAKITSKISVAVSEEELLPKPATTEEKVGVEEEEKIDIMEEEDGDLARVYGEIDFESPQAIETIIKEEEAIGDSLPNDPNEDEEGKTVKKIIGKELKPDNFQKGEKNGKELAFETTGSNKIVGNKGESRALVYRNIIGKTMACVPLANLLDLGYDVSDLERIQAEFLSIVVLDQRECPSMGVPSQWKIRDPRALAETTMVDSMEEASAMVKRINEEERKERDSISQRRRRQEARQPGTSKRTRGPPMTDEELARNGRRETNRRSTTTDGDGRSRKSEDGRRGDRRREGRRETQRTRMGEPPEDDRSGRDRRRQRRREPLDRDGNPRKIYRVPRDDTSSRRMASRDDPPDPDSPIWVSMDTFRDLLRKESEFRLKFIGDDWSEVVAEENDWRTGLYQSWLWSLNDGVGESFVPPSRYERARRNNPRVPRERPQAPRRAMQDNQPQESRRRRLRRLRDDDDELPTSGKKPRPLREREEQRGGQPPRSQQRTRRIEREAPDSPAGEDTTGAPTSSAQRRSRRRAERRRGPPPENPTY